MKNCAVVVLISGHGSNLQAIIDATTQKGVQYHVQAVISNREDAYGLIRAQHHQIPTEVIPSSAYTDRLAYDQALAAAIAQYHPDLIVLAGYMRILSKDFVQHYRGKMINIHPSLLPKYRGLHTHEQIIANQDPEHGATIHFVTPVLDGGPIICQAKFTVAKNPSIELLKAKIQQLEHRMYPLVIDWFAHDRLALSGDTVILDNQPLEKQGLTLDLASLMQIA